MNSELIALALHRFRLDPDSTHGLAHWQRVNDRGQALAAITAANVNVVRHFAYLHDACREDEWEDFDHGSRAAEWCEHLWMIGRIDLTVDELRLLQYACEHHSRGKTGGDITVQTCWDADRLDLGRVGITPATRFLCTQAARDMLITMQAKV